MEGGSGQGLRHQPDACLRDRRHDDDRIRLRRSAECRIGAAGFLAGVPGLMSRGAVLVEQLDAITRDGLVLAPETVAAIGAAFWLLYQRDSSRVVAGVYGVGRGRQRACGPNQQ